MTLKDDLSHEKFMREQFEQSVHNLLARAEAAEARAAALEDTLQKQLAIRDDLVIRVNELEAERNELARKLEQARNREQMDRAVMTEASAKIDELRQEARDSAGRIVTLMAELEQAKQVCTYWLHDGRFLVANSQEYKAAVEMLRTVSQSGNETP